MKSIRRSLSFMPLLFALYGCGNAEQSSATNAAPAARALFTNPEDGPSTREFLRSLSETEKREVVYGLNISCSADLALISTFAARAKDEKLAAQFEAAAQARLEHAIKIGTARTSDVDVIIKQAKVEAELKEKTENYSEEYIQRIAEVCAPQLMVELRKPASAN